MKNHINKLIMLFVFAIAMPAWSADQKEWTFLLFLNANNNLDSFGDMNLKQMEEIGSTDKVNIVVQWGSLARPTTKRLYIEKSTNPNEITSPVIEDLGAVDMGDYKSLTDFIKWGHDNYPAKKYFVAVWNHGNGWRMLRTNQIQPRDISYDDKTGNRITTEQLGVSLKDASDYIGRKIDIYGNDACLMSMIEVASEMKNSVSYFVGSQDLEPGEGWPYSTFLRQWTQNPEADGSVVSKLLTQEYLKAYSSGGIYGTNSVTLSAFDLNFVTDFEAAMKDLSAQITQLAPADLLKLRAAGRETIDFTYSDYKDVGHFLKMAETKQADLKSTSVARVREAIDKLVIANAVSPSFKDATGLSVWLPLTKFYLNSYGARYRLLNFNQSSQWIDSLELLAQ